MCCELGGGAISTVKLADCGRDQVRHLWYFEKLLTAEVRGKGSALCNRESCFVAIRSFARDARILKAMKRSVPPTPPTPTGGWRKKAHAYNRGYGWRQRCPIDFVFENPGGSKLWDHPNIKPLYTRNLEDGPNDYRLASLVETSYCHYGWPYQKGTSFLTTLLDLRLAEPCPRNKCPTVRKRGKHDVSVRGGSSQKERNSIPETLIHAVIDAWVARHPSKKHFMFFDMFAGWCSVCKAVRSWRLKRGGDDVQICVATNDLKSSRGALYNFDAMEYSIREMLYFALNRYYSHLGSWGIHSLERQLRERGVALLIHASTPCETYSQLGGNVHRASGSTEAHSEKGKAHDAMNAYLVSQLRELAFTPPECLVRAALAVSSDGRITARLECQTEW